MVVQRLQCSRDLGPRVDLGEMARPTRCPRSELSLAKSVESENLFGKRTVRVRQDHDTVRVVGRLHSGTIHAFRLPITAGHARSMTLACGRVRSVVE
jgi:hypothetical protein